VILSRMQGQAGPSFGRVQRILASTTSKAHLHHCWILLVLFVQNVIWHLCTVAILYDFVIRFHIINTTILAPRTRCNPYFDTSQSVILVIVDDTSLNFAGILRAWLSSPSVPHNGPETQIPAQPGLMVRSWPG
jgi:hypothetical protein